jgi:hypothetical protein
MVNQDKMLKLSFMATRTAHNEEKSDEVQSCFKLAADILVNREKPQYSLGLSYA